MVDEFGFCKTCGFRATDVCREAAEKERRIREAAAWDADAIIKVLLADDFEAAQ